MTRRKARQIDFLTTAVGRGHRFYLEGLRGALIDADPERKTRLFSASEVSGVLARPGWLAINFLYRRGSKSGWIGESYNRLRARNTVNDDSAALRLFGAGLREWRSSRNAPLVVDHPLLVRLMTSAHDKEPLIYMHGELVAPDESLAHGADLIITPTESVKRRFTDVAVPEERIAVSGLCVERSLLSLANEARDLRRKRIDTTSPLTGAFFSSGAEPPEHCHQIILAARSCLAQGQRVIVFAANRGRLQKMLVESGLMAAPEMRLQIFTSLADEERQLAGVFSGIDYFVAPAHERTNWALGLGLPFFILMPCFGSFAPLNHALALKTAHALEISGVTAANDFGASLEGRRKSGELQRMNAVASDTHGVNSYNNIDGFNQAAEALLRWLDIT